MWDETLSHEVKHKSKQQLWLMEKAMYMPILIHLVFYPIVGRSEKDMNNSNKIK